MAKTATFGGHTIVDANAKVVQRSPMNRSAMGVLPGTTGAYVQSNPRGPRRIVVQGVLDAASASALQTEIDTNQGDIGDTGTLVAAGDSYSYCTLARYTPSPIQSYTGGALAFVTAVFDQLAP